MKNILILLTACLLASCGGSDLKDLFNDTENPEEQKKISQVIFADSVNEFEVLVFYEPGAEPYTGNIGITVNDTWDVMKESVDALFSNHPLRIMTIPDELAEMMALPEQSKTQWTFDQIKALGDSIAPALKVGDKINMSLIFLNGTYEGRDSVLGIHLGGTHYAFVFKDVVTGVGGGGANQRYVEQATAVHELGHALGLVNNGLPMAEAHEDLEHPAHTTNDDGVMFWAVESADTISGALGGIIGSSQLNLFGPESLADARAYHP
jgi:hypothetical protein